MIELCIPDPTISGFQTALTVNCFRSWKRSSEVFKHVRILKKLISTLHHLETCFLQPNHSKNEASQRIYIDHTYSKKFRKIEARSETHKVKQRAKRSKKHAKQALVLKGYHILCQKSSMHVVYISPSANFQFIPFSAFWLRLSVYLFLSV